MIDKFLRLREDSGDERILVDSQRGKEYIKFELEHDQLHVDFICANYSYANLIYQGEMMNTYFKSLLVLILAFVLASCGSPAPVVGGEEEGEEGGVEAMLVTFSDAAQGFAIGYPSTWTQDKSFTNGVKFAGGDDWMTLEFVTPPAGTDAMTYAQNDVAAVSASFTNFKQLSLEPSSEVKDAVILGFTADGTSPVTGKSFTAHNERYYMPLPDGRIAVLTVFGPENHYDREGVRDIALTFKNTK